VVAELVAIGILILAVGAELLHGQRIRRIAALAFGPDRRPAVWASSAPLLRVASLTALSWGLLTLIDIDPKVHKGEVLADGDYKHVMLVLDVSPSMRLEDAGPEHDLSRMKRARVVMESFFKRVPMEQYRISVVAVYNEAKPVVVDTEDIDVVQNILGDLPMHYAFVPGETDLFAGLTEAIKLVKPWQPDSTTLILISDGDTVPATGMPKMPASVRNVLIVGIGDPTKGSFIAGRQSRQDTATLRQIAVRLGGTYHNGNENHLSTATLKSLTEEAEAGVLEKLSRREYALIASAAGGLIYAFLPLLLHLFGTTWKPGTRVSEQRVGARERSVV
jgi:Ca-activated chloride channel family protein